MRWGIWFLAAGAALAIGCEGRKAPAPAAGAPAPRAPGAKGPARSESDVFSPGQLVARLFGREITAGDLGLTVSKDFSSPPSPGSGAGPLSRLEKIAWEVAARQYLESLHLQATSEEKKDLLDFVARSTAPGTPAREEELARVGRLLSSGDLLDAERAQLEARRSLLSPGAPGPAEAAAAALIESAKLDGVLYKRFGGTVSVTRVGQLPLAARSALLQKHLRLRKLVVFDRRLDEAFRKHLGQAPPRPKAEAVDLTPFWKSTPAAGQK